MFYYELVVDLISLYDQNQFRLVPSHLVQILKHTQDKSQIKFSLHTVCSLIYYSNICIAVECSIGIGHFHITDFNNK